MSHQEDFFQALMDNRVSLRAVLAANREVDYYRIEVEPALINEKQGNTK